MTFSSAYHFKSLVFTTFSCDKYRFGFNTQEKVDEISGEGNHYTAEFWEYDTRLGRWWNFDPNPVEGSSQYSCFQKNPIFFMKIQ